MPSASLAPHPEPPPESECEGENSGEEPPRSPPFEDFEDRETGTGGSRDGDEDLDSEVHLEVHQRMVPTEAERVFISHDRKELHYIVPARRLRNYHTRYRDFVVVGFRLLHCSNTDRANPGHNDVVVGWCNGERHCPEPVFRRGTFPESDVDFSTDITGFPPLCDCAKVLYDHLGGHVQIRILLRDVQDAAVQFQRDGVPRVRDNWRVARHEYTIVNLNLQHALIFSQWGVSKLQVNQGWYTCLTCESRTRHCVHNKAILGFLNEQEQQEPGVSRKERAERSIAGLLDETGSLKPPCISREELPFFPNEDPDVVKHLQGKSYSLCTCLPYAYFLNSYSYCKKYCTPVLTA